MLNGSLLASLAGSAIASILAELLSQVDLPKDLASWIQSGGVVGILLWVVWTQRADHKEQQSRYDQLVKQHEAVTVEATQALREVSVEMARMRDQLEDVARTQKS